MELDMSATVSHMAEEAAYPELLCCFGTQREGILPLDTGLQSKVILVVSLCWINCYDFEASTQDVGEYL